MRIKKQPYELFIYILFGIFYLWLAAQIPYTHDDWDWGLEIGMQQWLTASVNSRYVGNFFEIIMTRSVFLKTFIMGGTFFLLPYLLSSIAAANSENKQAKPYLFLTANFLLLTMSRMIWSETYGWVAGFANFGLSSVFMLLCVKQWLPLCEENYVFNKRSVIFCVFVGLISFLGQLFIENLSIIMAALSIGACLVSYTRTKKIPSYYIVMSVAMLLGLCVMFSSSVYDSLFGAGQAVDGYRQLIVSADEGIASKLFNIFVQAARLITRAGEANFVLCITVLAVLTYKLITIKHKKPIHSILIVINGLFAMYFTVNFLLQTDYTADRLLLSAFAALVNGLYFLTVPAEALIIYSGMPRMQRSLVAVWLMGIALLAPLLVTNEAGYRLIFSLNIMVNLFVLLILEDIFASITLTNRLKISIIGAAILPVMVCAVVYSAIGQCNRLRGELIEQAAVHAASELTLPAYPHQNYLHAPDPIDQGRWEFFKEFYGIDKNVNVIIDSAD